MKSVVAQTFALWFAFSVSHAAAPDLAASAAAQAMAEAAQAFLDTLTPSQREKTTFEFSNDERLNWHYFPKSRKGIALKDLNQTQTKALHGILRSALSATGYDKVFNVVALERVLQQRSGLYDPTLYYISLFGQPGATKPWGWRFEGHHLSLNFTLVKGQFISTTPSFLGANPAEVKEGPKHGLRTLRGEEDMARELLMSLNERQRAVAVVDSRSYGQIVSGASQQADPLPAEGIAARDLTNAQRELLLKLLVEYANTARPDLAKQRLDKISAAGLDTVTFAWAGGVRRGEPHYYRIQGPTFLLEYDNSQNSANHIHSVWRDFASDFGRDLLREHYARDSHQRTPPKTGIASKAAF